MNIRGHFVQKEIVYSKQGWQDLARSTNHIVRPRVRCGLANSLASAACYSHFEEPGMSSENEIPVADLPEEQNSGSPQRHSTNHAQR